ncbi:MAG: small nuclear ribonucleoprotein [Candidatus Woesearchaeota archaeon]|jgi:small nuclear ribonucleoprotein|nr:small nuclear ribonucleoprotein [Candidatus Woesearchaeota archaeon]
MLMETVRPLDVLNRTKGKEITVLLKNNQVFNGKLKAFDIHLNLVLFEAKEVMEDKTLEIGDMLIRGDAIITIKNI